MRQTERFKPKGSRDWRGVEEKGLLKRFNTALCPHKFNVRLNRMREM